MNHHGALHRISCCRFIGRPDIRPYGYNLADDGDLARGQRCLQADKVHASRRHIQLHLRARRAVDRQVRRHHATDELHRQV